MNSIRPISWLKGVLRDFQRFPFDVQQDAESALTVASRGGKADSAKPFKGFGTGVFEIALRHRVIYHVQIGKAIWVIHAFQKKSKTGIKTPQTELDLIGERIKRLKEALQSAKTISNWCTAAAMSFATLVTPIPR